MQSIQNSLETLEGRTMFAATPLVVAEVAFNGGIQLQINGTNGNDVINVSQSTKGLVVSNNTGWSATYNKSYKSILVHTNGGNDVVNIASSVKTNCTLYGDSGNDSLNAGSGNDTLYAGAGNDTLRGGMGNDVLVSVNGFGKDVVIGGAGENSFWTNASDTLQNVTQLETRNGDVHRISSFYAGSTAVKAAAKTTVKAEPTMTDGSMTYVNYSGHVLFADNGPTANDIEQGYVGDCYFLSTLSSVAKIDPKLIRQSVVDLGDGTYAVRFFKGTTQVYVRVDASLPTWYNQPAYANLGAQGSMWVAVMEKAFTVFRSGADSYASIEGGWMDEVYRDLGAKPTDLWTSGNSTSLVTWIQGQLAAGKSVTFAVGDAAYGSLITDHAYMVDSVGHDSTGKLTLRLRNPWGVDGVGNDGNNDGYVTITAQQAFNSMLCVTSASV